MRQEIMREAPESDTEGPGSEPEPEMIGDVPADVAAEALREHYDRHGVIVAEAVVQEAEDPESPLHPAFEWDDSRAAHHHRVWQARMLIRACRVRVEGGGEEHAFANVQIKDRKGYHPIDVIAKSETLFDSALAGLMRKLVGAQRAVRELKRHASGRKQKTRANRLHKTIGEAIEAAKPSPK